jgi:hypothetical protein
MLLEQPKCRVKRTLDKYGKPYQAKSVTIVDLDALEERIGRERRRVPAENRAARVKER